MQSFPCWDGTYYGELYQNQILFVCEDNEKYPVYFISFYRECYFCSIQSSTTAYPCIIDEACSLFGLDKLGSHTITYNGKSKVMYRLPSSNLIHLGQIGTGSKLKGSGEQYLAKELVKSSCYSNIDSFLNRLQDILVFRIIMNIGKNDASSIIFSNGRLYSLANPLSTLENHYVSDAIVNKVMISNVSDSIKRFQINTSKKLLDISEKLEDIICRIDRNFFWLIALMKLNISEYS